MIEIKNKVIFLRNSLAGIDREYQASANVQGKLKKKVTRLKKMKIAEKVTVKLTGTHKKFEVEIDPADSKHAPMIKAHFKL